jgi:hypothetical protein
MKEISIRERLVYELVAFEQLESSDGQVSASMSTVGQYDTLDKARQVKAALEKSDDKL